MSQQEPSHDFSIPSPERYKGKRPVSERKLQANRRNALRSTGPRTERGKRTVSRNATKHGFLAREVVITAGDGEESLEEFHALVENLWNFYEPAGVVEEALVQTIAASLWRKARVIRAENGEIRTRLDTLRVGRALRNSNKANLELALSEMGRGLSLYSSENQTDKKVSTRDRWSAMQVAQSNLRGHHESLAYLNALLMNAKSEITSDGYISEQSCKKIVSAFCFWDALFTLMCVDNCPAEGKIDGASPAQSGNKQTEGKRADVVAAIDSQLEMLSGFERYALKRENLEVDAEARSFSLPSADATDKLLRYEAHLDRQLYRAMDQLERLQRQRRGETVPPPLNINLGKRS